MGEIKTEVLLVYFYRLRPLLFQRVVFCDERSVDWSALLEIICCDFCLNENPVCKMQKAQKLKVQHCLAVYASYEFDVCHVQHTGFLDRFLNVKIEWRKFAHLDEDSGEPGLNGLEIWHNYLRRLQEIDRVLSRHGWDGSN